MWRRVTIAPIATRPPRQTDPNHACFQLQRRTRGAARRGIAQGRRRDARLARQRHVGDGDEPSRQGVHRHRREGGSRPAHAARNSRRLRGAVPPGRGDRGERDRPDEPARRQIGRGLRQHGRVVEEVDQGGEEVLPGEYRRVGGGSQLHLRAGTRHLAALARRGLCPRLHQRDDRRGRIPLDPGHRRRTAGRRHVVAHPVASRRRREVRRDLRRRAEEHRTGGPDARHRAQGSARPRAADHAVGVSLEGAGGGRLDAQHAADVRDLYRGTGVRVAARARGSGRDRGEEHGQGRPPLRLPRPDRVLSQSGATRRIVRG